MTDRGKSIGFIGLGAMGSAMACRLLAAGFQVTGFDVSARALERFIQQGGKVASTAREAALSCKLLVVMVFDSAQADAALFDVTGAVSAMPAESTVWLASTVEPAYARSLAARLAAKQLELIDGPVSGGVSGAKKGTLTVIASGSDAAITAGEAAMRACASNVYRVGTVGAGSTVKLVNQILAAAHIALTAEAIALGVRAGVDPRLLVDVITHGSGASRQFERRAPRMIAGDHTPHSTVRMFLKDLAIALETARQLDLPTPLAACAQQIFTMAAGAGFADESDTALIHLYERLGGFRINEEAGR